MYAMLIDDKKQFVWSEVQDPVRKPNEVLMEIHAAALNRADLMQREGNYPPPPGWPEWPGLEAAGIVLEAPEGSRWKKGDRVCALLGGGGYAEKVTVPADMVLPVPDGLSMIEAAAIPEVFATAYLNFCIEGEMKSGDTVFIQAGASGLGLAAIQLAKLYGCRVVTTVGTPDKADFVRNLGADVIVNHRTDDLCKILESNPPNIALDCVGGRSVGACLEKMAPRGRWIMIATLGGELTEINLNSFFKRGLRLIGSTLRSRTSEMKAMILGELEKSLWSKFTSKAIRPIIYRSFPIAEVESAHAVLQRRENIGKVVLTLK